MEQKLPHSITIDALMGRALPSDTTLGTMTGWFNNSDMATKLRGSSRTKQVRIRFMRLEDDEELPATMTLREFHALVDESMAAIVIDDGEGGVGAKMPEVA